MTDNAPPAGGQGATFAPGDNMQPVMLGNTVLGYRRGIDKPPVRRKVGIGTLRLAAIQRLILGRHGGPCDTDDGELYLDAAAPLIVASARRRGVVPDLVSWARQFTPRLHDDHDAAWFLDRAEQHDNDPGHGISADDFARLLGITAAEVKAFGLKSVGAVDRPKRQRQSERKVANRLCKQKKREADGATPRHKSLTAMKPWDALGMKRSKWYALGKPEVSWTNAAAPTTPHKVVPKSSTHDHANDDQPAISARTVKVELVEKVVSNTNEKNSPSKAG